MDLLWDDVAATAVFSIQLYESYKHFHVFNQYLERVGFHPIDGRGTGGHSTPQRRLRYDDGTRLLTRYMMSEHFAAFHFMKDARQAREPVLRHILKLVGRDELRHTQFAYELLALRIARNPGRPPRSTKRRVRSNTSGSRSSRRSRSPRRMSSPPSSR